VQNNFTQLVTRNETIPITQPTSWQQTITPIILSHANNVSFPSHPMWYNVILPYLFLDSNLYPRYFNGMKMFELVNPRNHYNFYGMVPLSKAISTCNGNK
jgi:hypothetical protein